MPPCDASAAGAEQNGRKRGQRNMLDHPNSPVETLRFHWGYRPAESAESRKTLQSIHDRTASM
jgi:hypothetical protein